MCGLDLPLTTDQ